MGQASHGRRWEMETMIRTLLLTLLFCLLPWTVKAQNPKSITDSIPPISPDDRVAESWGANETFPPWHWRDDNRDTTGNYRDYVLFIRGGAEGGGWLGLEHPDSHLVSMGTVRRMIDSTLADLAYRDSVIISQATHRAITSAWDTPFDWHRDKYERVDCPDSLDNCIAEHYDLRTVYGPEED